jgi:hypothetical protein
MIQYDRYILYILLLSNKLIMITIQFPPQLHGWRKKIVKNLHDDLSQHSMPLHQNQ